MKNSKKIIGITGLFGSGKSTAAAILKDKGFKTVSLSSYLKDLANERGLTLTRTNLQDLGNEVRKKHGAGFLVKKALKEYKNEEKIVIDGIRNVGEIEELRKVKGSILLAILADRKVRFNRLKKNKRREELDEKLFYQLDLRDLGVNERITGLQTAFCIALADTFIVSSNSIKNFKKDIDNFLLKYE